MTGRIGGRIGFLRVGEAGQEMVRRRDRRVRRVRQTLSACEVKVQDGGQRQCRDDDVQMTQERFSAERGGGSDRQVRLRKDPRYVEVKHG
jgi:hypothetical protein